MNLELLVLVQLLEVLPEQLHLGMAMHPKNLHRHRRRPSLDRLERRLARHLELVENLFHPNRHRRDRRPVLHRERLPNWMSRRQLVDWHPKNLPNHRLLRPYFAMCRLPSKELTMNLEQEVKEQERHRRHQPRHPMRMMEKKIAPMACWKRAPDSMALPLQPLHRALPRNRLLEEDPIRHLRHRTWCPSEHDYRQQSRQADHRHRRLDSRPAVAVGAAERHHLVVHLPNRRHPGGLAGASLYWSSTDPHHRRR